MATGNVVFKEAIKRAAHCYYYGRARYYHCGIMNFFEHATTTRRRRIVGEEKWRGATCSSTANNTRTSSFQCHYMSSSQLSTSSEENDPQQDNTSSTRVSTRDQHQEEHKRFKLKDVLISDVLKAKHSFRWVDPVIYQSASVKEAIQTTIDGGLSGMMVLDNPDSKHVVGLLTSRDILRILSMGIQDNLDNDTLMNRQIGEFMTPFSQVIYGRPDETVGMCRTIMAKLGIKCLPILKDGRVEGLITARDMSDFGLSAKDKGGKKSFLDDVSERVGLGANTSMAEPPLFLKAHLALERSHAPLYINVGVSELPHPFKTEEGCGMSRRDHGPRGYSTDPTLSEDAYFIANVDIPDEKGETEVAVTYLGVADGVGSWRQYGVDPRNFSRRLMEECKNVVLSGESEETTTTTRTDSSSSSNNKKKKKKKQLTPSEVLEEAYERVKDADIIGSSTACVAVFDNFHHQLHFSNLGDSGIIVLRHIDSEVAGALKRNRTTPRSERKSDLRVAFVSQQQLKSFNHPFQLGWTGEDIMNNNNNNNNEEVDDDSSFKSARDACVSSVHLRRGDIIIMATDGLFDNIDVDDITSIALEWEQTTGFIRSGDISARERRWKMGNSLTVLSSERIKELSDALVKKARENSLDSTTDSPFAILAKENDIMWSGGMPDDCTVIAMHVCGRSAPDVMDAQNQ